MTALDQLAGIEITWGHDGTLHFGDDLIVSETKACPLEMLRDVALDPDSCLPPGRIQYWMYNGIAHKADHDVLSATGMRFGLTLIFPYPIGRERAKTRGHIHTWPQDRSGGQIGRYNYPQICEVLSGKAQFFFQTIDVETRSAPFCAMIEASPGDKVIIPPNVHHLTVCAGDEPLVFADVIPGPVEEDYTLLAKMRGAAYFNTLHEGIIQNPAYESVAELLRFPVHLSPQLGLTPDRSLYRILVETPQALAWMMMPDRFSKIFPDIWADFRTAYL